MIDQCLGEVQLGFEVRQIPMSGEPWQACSHTGDLIYRGVTKKTGDRALMFVPMFCEQFAVLGERRQISAVQELFERLQIRHQVAPYLR